MKTSILNELDQRPAASGARSTAALATVRIALATRPPLPITRPRSSSATRDLEHEVAVLLDLLDLDRVGSSTSARARNSTSSRIRR